MQCNENSYRIIEKLSKNVIVSPIFHIYRLYLYRKSFFILTLNS